MKYFLVSVIFSTVIWAFMTYVPTSARVSTPLASVDDDPCHDLRDCSDYDIHTACCGQYEAFGRQICPAHCRFCTPMVTKAPLCTDTISICKDYETDLCTNPSYTKFVETKCAGFCELCNKTVYIPPCAQGATGTAESTVAATTVPVGDPDCKDSITNCLDYGHPYCGGPYETWARINCQAFCGYCIPITSPFICEDKITTCNQYEAGLCTNPEFDVFVENNCLKYCRRCPGELTSPPPKTGCFDDFERCDEFGKVTCTNYPSWAKLYCAKHCDFCASNDTSEAPTSLASTSSLDPDCFDRRDCSVYDIHTSCCGAYEAYSRYTCAKYCKFCTPKVTEAPVCTDKIPNCNQLNEDLCTNQIFEKYVAENCAGFCQLCNRTPYVPECARESTTAAPDCQDKLPDCDSYGIPSCSGPYESWARHNCRAYCGFCNGEPTLPAPNAAHGCFNNFGRCDEFGTGTCIIYSSWSKLYCAKYCNLCEVETTSPTEVNDCVDIQDCSGFDVHTTCCGQYETFTRRNCARHCGFCTSTVTEADLCVDTINNCTEHPKDLCTNPTYYNFVKANCAGFCNLCEKARFIPPCAQGGIIG